MERFVRQTLLFDFYGILLTDHQREIYEDVVCNDISFSEVAERENVSRQNIHELVRKCDRLMEDYEQKLHLMERYLTLKSLVDELKETINDPVHPFDPEALDILCDRILEEL